MKEKILHYFRDINSVYNDCTKYDTLKAGLEKMEQDQMILHLKRIRDECQERKQCEGCPYSCKYFVNHDGKLGTRYACVLKEIPERWQLETMEGLKDGR